MISLEKLGKNAFINGAKLLLGRRNLVRLGRFISNEARLDVPNEIDRNGEAIVQTFMLKRAEAGSKIVIIDAGANVGLWTRQLLVETQHRSSVSVHLFEPCCSTFKTLAANLSEWQLEGSTVVNNKALSSRDGQGLLYARGLNAGTSSLYGMNYDSQIGSTEQISLEMCTTYCERNAIVHIDFMKIDTEGHDMEVILGARSMLQENRIDALQFEYNWRWIDARHFLKDAFTLLLPLGYSIGKITPAGIEFYDRWYF